MFGWFKKLNAPYEGSNDKFIAIVRDMRKALEEVKTLDDFKTLNAQVGLLTAYMTTQGDIRIIDEMNAELAFLLMKFQVQNIKDSHEN